MRDNTSSANHASETNTNPLEDTAIRSNPAIGANGNDLLGDYGHRQIWAERIAEIMVSAQQIATMADHAVRTNRNLQTAVYECPPTDVAVVANNDAHLIARTIADVEPASLGHDASIADFDILASKKLGRRINKGSMADLRERPPGTS